MNAVLEEMEKRSIPCHLQCGSLVDDINYLLGASHLVYGHGTFGIAISMLARPIETLHAFGKSLKNAYSALGVIAELCVYDARPGTYIPENGWTASPEQRDLMIRFSEEELELVFETAGI